MAVVAGLIFFFIRAFFALIPGLADKKMGGLRRLDSDRLLSRAFLQSGRNATLVHHDRSRFAGRVVRPSHFDDAHADGGRDTGPACPRIGRASELSDVVCRNAGARCRLRATR